MSVTPQPFNLKLPVAQADGDFQAQSLDTLVSLQDQLNQQNASVQASIAALQAAIIALSGLIPTGGILPYGKATAPTGFLLCDGAAVSRTTYAALYAVIGTGFGAGDGSTTFNVPDFGYRIPVGNTTGHGVNENASGSAGTAPSGASSSAGTIGAWSGSLTQTLVTANLPAHSHTIPVAVGGSLGGQAAFGSASGSSGNTIEPTGNTGSATAINTWPPLVLTAYIIKT